MKKILLVLTLLIGLTLSGCGETTQDLKEGVYTKEEVDEMLLDLDRRINDFEIFINGDLSEWAVGINQRLVDLEELDSYTVEQIKIIVYIYELEKSKSIIEQQAIDEGRELTPDEELLILGYDILIDINEDLLEEE